MLEDAKPPSYGSTCVGVTRTSNKLPPPFSGRSNMLSSSTSDPTDDVLSVSFPRVTEEEIRNACYSFAAEHCCYGSRFIERMQLPERRDRIAFVYTLESYTEKRESVDYITSYSGEEITFGGVHISDSIDDVPPNPWDMEVTPQPGFKNHRTTVEIPYTAGTVPCNSCRGVGTTRCNWCFGIGGKGCILCISSERYRPCTSCRYSNRWCMFCSGKGKVSCSTCDGRAVMRKCKRAVITWTNHIEHFISDHMKLPSALILAAKGRELLTEQKKELLPIIVAPDVSVNIASTDLIAKHKTAFVNENIIRQRQTLRAIPYTQLIYQWRYNVGEFYIYGLEKKAHFEKYPQTCCCAVM